ncbi:tetrahydrofolate dehydrogenase/cyclohydrolase catalytic domain-containing protein, partial [Acidithiobacillus thiooxidans]
MTAQRIDGKAIAKKLQAETAEKSRAFLKNHGRPPGLAVVLVGNNPASEVYVQKKRDTCKSVGIHSLAVNLPAVSSPEQLLQKIAELNADDRIDGILVQLPLPPQFDPEVIIEAIAVEKDVDGFHPYNV